MKFELVEFYPAVKSPNKKFLGSVHIYAIDAKLDIRGIRVFQKNNMFFSIPFQKCIDDEGVLVQYPIISWTDDDTQKEMMGFLKTKVKPIILKAIAKKPKNP